MRDKGYRFMDSDAAGNAILDVSRCSFSILLESNTRLNLTSCYLLCRSFSALEVSECLLHRRRKNGYLSGLYAFRALVKSVLCRIYLSDSVSEIYQFVIYIRLR